MREILVEAVEDPVAFLACAPAVPLPPSRFSIPKAPGAPILSKSIVRVDVESGRVIAVAVLNQRMSAIHDHRRDVAGLLG